MTNKEAIEILYGHNGNFEELCVCVPEHKEAIELAIQALEKQIPKTQIKHTINIYGIKFEEGCCPICGNVDVASNTKYCDNCGQKLKWED